MAKHNQRKFDHAALDRSFFADAYRSGNLPPNFPVPAIPTRVCLDGIDEMWNSAYIEEHRITEENGEVNHVVSLVCIWDFNFDRAMDFHYKCGQYVNEREMEEGIEKYYFDCRMAAAGALFNAP